MLCFRNESGNAGMTSGDCSCPIRTAAMDQGQRTRLAYQLLQDRCRRPEAVRLCTAISDKNFLLANARCTVKHGDTLLGAVVI
jgi:hypothetical protein